MKKKLVDTKHLILIKRKGNIFSMKPQQINSNSYKLTEMSTPYCIGGLLS